MMARMIGMAVVLVMVLISSAHGQVCGGGTLGIYNEAFDIEKQVDAARYVQRAVVTNNARGDYTFEFMAALASGRERWTVTFEKDPSFKLVQHLDVNGNRRYSMKLADVGGTYHITLETPTASATIAATSPPGDTSAFAAIAMQTAADRDVVQTVVEEVLASMEGPLSDCMANCGPNPGPCDTPSDAQGCVDWFACRMQQIDWEECGGNCVCAIYPNISEAEDCCAALAATIQALLDYATNDFVACLQQYVVD